MRELNEQIIIFSLELIIFIEALLVNICKIVMKKSMA